MIGKRPPRSMRALTIEYAILMMLIVTAFIGLILTSAMLSTDSSAGYTDYVDCKMFLDRAGETYAAAFGAEGCLDKLENNAYGCTFKYNETQLTVMRDGECVLTVTLGDADADGLTEITAYRYGT